MSLEKRADYSQITPVMRMYGDVSRETFERLSKYVDLVRKWQPAQNLISQSTMEDIWMRHVADCIQIQRTLPDARSWIDFGSGAGFPGLVTAMLLKQEGEDGIVHMVESNQRKVAFLRTVAREAGCNVKVHAGRIETVTNGWEAPIEGVSARALASLRVLCGFSSQFVQGGASAVFHKGQDFRREIEDASADWSIDLVEKVSLVDPLSRVLVLSKIELKNC